MGREVKNFSWVIKGELAGAGIPAVFLTDHAQMDALQELKQLGVKAIVSLTEDPFISEIRERFDFDYLWVPIPDRTPPLLNEITTINAFIDRCIARGRPVVVHCFGGHGRTGTILACYLVSQGATWREAITRVRELREGSIEVGEQVEAIYDFWQIHNNIDETSDFDPDEFPVERSIYTPSFSTPKSDDDDVLTNIAHLLDFEDAPRIPDDDDDESLTVRY